MKLNQVVVASLIEEDMDNVIVEMNTLIHTIDLVEEDRIDMEELSVEEDFPNYGYGSHVSVIRLNSLGGRYFPLLCVNTLSGVRWVAYYSYVRGEVRFEGSVEEYEEEAKRYHERMEALS